MSQITSKQVTCLKPSRAFVHCAFDGTGTWWESRPALVYRGSHRYGRWCCSVCGRTRDRVAHYVDACAKTVEAMKAGPGTRAWDAYTHLDTYA